MVRVHVYDVLTKECGWSDQNARDRGKNVSHYYDNHIRTTKAPKDGQNVAINDETDVPGLIEAARNIKDGGASANAYAKPTKFAGFSLEDMGF
ncbi:hypothetical protein OWR29_00095 [Actinoplanes sp. Pm04-4]|uniref:Uncharacterized protein n=1 Tax=Paractinoplanes pyxinae TaxID=2997416 RepID=A0ABT4ASJ8_9ACTN|nr:hypothetical protein [Actinoplanes pyxinae]MCY1136380.1 hypothetical protein [Actinoplanes pyxinae]